MSILNLADNIKIGSDQVKLIYLDSVLVWFGGLDLYLRPAPNNTNVYRQPGGDLYKRPGSP